MWRPLGLIWQYLAPLQRALGNTVQPSDAGHLMEKGKLGQTVAFWADSSRSRRTVKQFGPCRGGLNSVLKTYLTKK
ncbi:hypothetical protein PXNS11_350122 [Stutzerimonas xanthomarina]|nr:hypothetical protein PXNS11_350122 [Stutzerimonas xanthomarina]